METNTKKTFIVRYFFVKESDPNEADSITLEVPADNKSNALDISDPGRIIDGTLKVHPSVKNQLIKNMQAGSFLNWTANEKSL